MKQIKFIAIYLLCLSVSSPLWAEGAPEDSMQIPAVDVVGDDPLVSLDVPEVEESIVSVDAVLKKVEINYGQQIYHALCEGNEEKIAYLWNSYCAYIGDAYLWALNQNDLLTALTMAMRSGNKSWCERVKNMALEQDNGIISALAQQAIKKLGTLENTIEMAKNNEKIGLVGFGVGAGSAVVTALTLIVSYMFYRNGANMLYRKGANHQDTITKLNQRLYEIEQRRGANSSES